MPGPKIAEFEQVAAEGRDKSSRPGKNPLQRGAKRNIASGQIVLLCAFSKAVKSTSNEKNEDSSSTGTSNSRSGSRVSVDESVTTSEDDLENTTE